MRCNADVVWILGAWRQVWRRYEGMKVYSFRRRTVCTVSTRGTKSTICRATIWQNLQPVRYRTLSSTRKSGVIFRMIQNWRPSRPFHVVATEGVLSTVPFREGLSPHRSRGLTTGRVITASRDSTLVSILPRWVMNVGVYIERKTRRFL